ncbi:MAG: hypothetical protein A3C85_04705 [Candidatus Doudnabacteria bacterium RIFCSPHIGHO2_02_FULL_48_21]|uniref:Uncharacterized protein n=1 Tax=Candidatus Doudnabacteria bacterium RIFCSPLOWO2_02_FULL_48_13 TaxID=1817845 RepID=A0A1F5Q885_9BACT|nr:MAG: hypothetical protein A3K05_01015 [Candidatus Doudnabacteria bacterium RIFCSPHIGHO2_01_48_18]OGE78001.1 MAG: hypothetical protein A2668_01875 [Candidatus Doudnabacteria bacterium RIFCSPHIGHO2_01_FULL_48_180]OGE91038.1 MAG: hypothetical protein A3F44_01795 [Candidatus Doudnabacteria bacterium RIFCSPHIGHO2_12_FULL_47_25]OGE93402.1 MAG: hypothetical protein A3C85_04705 [Candidatus Doudnabacteria bacterium RIFCSPHIGHO2_02_FULL_48_21]OGE97414.1 MAG: hypothetical protein A3A83_01825 [Candidatu
MTASAFHWFFCHARFSLGLGKIIQLCAYYVLVFDRCQGVVKGESKLYREMGGELNGTKQ